MQPSKKQVAGLGERHAGTPCPPTHHQSSMTHQASLPRLAGWGGWPAAEHRVVRMQMAAWVHPPAAMTMTSVIHDSSGLQAQAGHRYRHTPTTTMPKTDFFLQVVWLDSHTHIHARSPHRLVEAAAEAPFPPTGFRFS